MLCMRSIDNGVKDNRMRLGVGKWRIIYNYTKDNDIKILLVIDIGNRGDIYK